MMESTKLCQIGNGDDLTSRAGGRLRRWRRNHGRGVTSRMVLSEDDGVYPSAVGARMLALSATMPPCGLLHESPVSPAQRWEPGRQVFDR